MPLNHALGPSKLHPVIIPVAIETDFTFKRSNVTQPCERVHVSPHDRHFDLPGGRYREEKKETDHYKVTMQLAFVHLEREDFMAYQCVCRNTLGLAESVVRLYRESLFELRHRFAPFSSFSLVAEITQLLEDVAANEVYPGLDEQLDGRKDQLVTWDCKPITIQFTFESKLSAFFKSQSPRGAVATPGQRQAAGQDAPTGRRKSRLAGRPLLRASFNRRLGQLVHDFIHKQVVPTPDDLAVNVKLVQTCFPCLLHYVICQ